MSDNQNAVLNRKIQHRNNMKAQYSSPVITVDPEISIYEALRQMQINFIKRVVIVSKNKPVGIITERDINRFLEYDKTSKALNEIPVKHVMQKNIISIVDGLEDHLNQCATRMVTFRIGSVILVNDDGELVGIVTKTDITEAFGNTHGGKYLVKDFMTSRTVTCRKSDTLRYALNLMNTNDVSRLVVTDENGYPIGLITTNTLLIHSDYFSRDDARDRDYLIPKKKGADLKVKDLMTSELLTINQEEDLAGAANLMIKNKISGIPVVDNKRKLVGVVSKFDIVRAFTVVSSHEELKTKYAEFY